MKKHDEGYVMILVLVVMIVMGLVTASILTFSLRNLQNQQLSIERMADKYAAQGIIEDKLNEIETADTETVVLKSEGFLTVGAKRAEDNSTILGIILTAEHGKATVSCVISSEHMTLYGDGFEIGKVFKIDSYTITYSNPEEVAGQ